VKLTRVELDGLRARRLRPTLSLVVPLFNEAVTAGVLLERLVAMDIPGVDVEIVVVESNSTDGTRDIALAYAEHPRVAIVLQDRPLGKGNAVREGLAHVSGDIIGIQDGDLE